MALKYSVEVRNAQMNQLETTVGASPILRIYTGTEPASTAAAPTGSVLVEITLPASWLAAAASGFVSIDNGPYTGTATGTGDAGYYRIWNSGDTLCHIQGKVTDNAGDGQLKLDSVAITTGDPITITACTFGAGN
jgi:hypothetical protein